MDFDFNRRCDHHPFGNQKDGALLVSVISPLADDYETYEKGKCILDSASDGGFVLVRLGNDVRLGQEVRAHLQAREVPETQPGRHRVEDDREHPAQDRHENQERRTRLFHLLGEMLVEAEYFVAGQPLKLKATTPQAALEEAMEYLIQNTFSKMSYLKRLCADPLKEIQAVLRSNDINQQQLLFQTGENNPQAIEDVRNYVELCTNANRQIVLHDMIEKRYAIRPYGWPDEEVLLLVARLFVLGEISLVMDSTPILPEKVYEAITAPAKRRKILVVKRQTSDPKAVQKRPQPGQRPVLRDGAGRRGRPVHLPAGQAEGLAGLAWAATSPWPTPATTPARTRSRRAWRSSGSSWASPTASSSSGSSTA